MDEVQRTEKRALNSLIPLLPKKVCCRKNMDTDSLQHSATCVVLLNKFTPAASQFTLLATEQVR